MYFHICLRFAEEQKYPEKKELGAAESHPGTGEVVSSSTQAGSHENIATGNLLQNRTLS